MSDHNQYAIKERLSNDVIDANDAWQDPAKENNSDFELDQKLIALVEFRPWIYDKDAKKIQDKNSIEKGWQDLADYLNITGMILDIKTI